MADDQWDRLEPEDLSRLNDRRLRRQIRHQLYPYSPFYRRVLDGAGITGQGLRGAEDLNRLPFTTRETLAAAPEDFVLRAPETSIQLRGPARQINRVVLNKLLRGVEGAQRELSNEYQPVHTLETTGTTDEPLQIHLTRRDLAVLSTQASRALQVAGVTAKDFVLSLLEPSSAGGFWPIWLGAISMGAEMLAPGTIDPEFSAALANKTLTTVMVGRAEDLLNVVETSGGIDSLRTLILAPERVSPTLKRRIRESVGDRVSVISTYGFSEGRSLWTECREGSYYPDAGFHGSGYELFETIQPGEIAFTGIDHRGTALVRYQPGDVAAGGIRKGGCPYCGRTVDRIMGPIIRSANFIEINLAGEDPLPMDVERFQEALAHPSLASWQVEVAKADGDSRGPDEVFVLFEPREGRHPAEVSVELDRIFKVDLGLSPTQLILSDRGMGKVVDLRPADLPHAGQDKGLLGVGFT